MENFIIYRTIGIQNQSYPLDLSPSHQVSNSYEAGLEESSEGQHGAAVGQARQEFTDAACQLLNRPGFLDPDGTGV